MNNEKLYDAITHIDEELLDLSKNESCDKNSRKGKVNNMSKRINHKKLWIPIAACLVVAFAAIGFLTFGQNKAPVQTPDGAACATTVLYNNNKYLSIVTEEDAKKIGLPLTITPEMVGEHLAYVKLDGEFADYEETSEKTDKEIMQYANETDNDVLILRDGSSYWAITAIK